MTPVLLAVLLASNSQVGLTGIDSLLRAGDTSTAIAALRVEVKQTTAPRAQCRLATLLAKRVTDRSEDWRERSEAQDLFESSVRHDPNAECYLAYADLRQKQHLSLEASRLASHAFDLLQSRPEQLTPALRADFYYQRARPIANWVRNFEHLVVAPDIAVSTPACTEMGFFCEAMVHPSNFAEKLERGTRLDGLVDGQRRIMAALLDSALALDPTSPDALRLALRDAIVATDWVRFDALSQAAHRYDPLAPGPMLDVLASLVHDQKWLEASSLFDTVMTRLGPEATARFEGLALVVDSSMRERLRGRQHVVYGEAVWGLSDPLYLTPYNERRLTHYARVTLADVMLTDPTSGSPGRNTDQGRLVIRYGWPEEWFEVKADKSLELTTEEMRQLAATTACTSTPLKRYNPGNDTMEGCTTTLSNTTPQGGGRWAFWFYPHQAPLIFDRSLGYWTARHKQFTESRALDSAMYRSAPSTFNSPYPEASVHALVTRFPHGPLPSVEVHAQATWLTHDTASRSPVEVGIFVHDPLSGREITRFVRSAPVTDGIVTFGAPMEVPWGRLRLAVETKVSTSGASGQLRAFVILERGSVGGLTMSDILLGDSASAPALVERRQDVQFWPRSDSVYPPRGPMALYWETYGLGADTLNGNVHFRMRVSMEDAGGRAITATLWRGATSALGLRETSEHAIEWEETRPNRGAAMPGLLLLTSPNDDGRYRVNVTITDLDTGRTATVARTISLQRQGSQ